jgi:hypothetical protein
MLMIRATAATNALDHQADIATTRIYDHRKTAGRQSNVQGQLLRGQTYSDSDKAASGRGALWYLNRF